MTLVYKSRFYLIRFAKVFPFFLCFITCISFCEILYALSSMDFVLYDGSLTPNTPMAWMIAKVYKFGIYSIFMAIVFAIAFETCIWNKLSIAYCASVLGQQSYFINIELYIEYIYAIGIVNIIISAFFVWKGTTIFLKNFKIFGT